VAPSTRELVLHTRLLCKWCELEFDRAKCLSRVVIGKFWRMISPFDGCQDQLRFSAEDTDLAGVWLDAAFA
jgi:hypothetical protein